MNDVDWTELRLFLQVARAGTLAGAAMATGISAPTLGRRMRALETALGRSLFCRSRNGYAMTPDGRALYDRVRHMEEAASAIETWSEGPEEQPIVTVAAGNWLSEFLRSRIASVWTPNDGFRLCLKTKDLPVAIEHREATIALVRRRPETGNVIARRLGSCAYAPFAARGTDGPGRTAWVSLAREVAVTPAERWAADRPKTWIAAWADSRELLYGLVAGGAGRGLLPCHLGDSDPGLMRAGGIVDEVEEQLWLVAHADERHRPEVRVMIDRLCSFFDERKVLLSGMLGAGAGSRGCG